MSHESEEILKMWEHFQEHFLLINNNSFIWQEALFPSDEADLTISRNVFPPKSLFSSSLLAPEELIQRTPEHLTDLDAQVDGRIIITLFDRADRLPGLHLVIYKYILLILFIYSDMVILFVNQREPAKGGIIWQF